jgi:hypothetical protein
MKTCRRWSNAPGSSGITLRSEAKIVEYRRSRIEDRGLRIEDRLSSIFHLRSSIFDLPPEAIPFRPLFIRYGMYAEPLVLPLKFITKSYVI